MGEQGLGEIERGPNLVESTKKKGNVESHDPTCHEERRYVEEEKKKENHNRNKCQILQPPFLCVLEFSNLCLIFK